MRNPIQQQNKYAKRIAKIASNSDEQNQWLWRIVDIIKLESATGKHMADLTLKNAVVARAIKEGCDDIHALKLYNAAANSILPFLDSGSKYARVDGMLDSLVATANKHLIQTAMTPDGDEVEKLDVNVMNAIIKALGVKMSSLTKLQQNLIAAQKEVDNKQESNDLDITHLEREQLERLVSGQLIDNPEIIEKVIQRTKNSRTTLPGFHEGLDEEL